MKKIIITIAVVIIGAIIVFLNSADFITDIIWLDKLGYLGIFMKNLYTRMAFFIPIFILTFLVNYFYLKTLKENYSRLSSVILSVKEARFVRILSSVASLGIALLVAGSLSSSLWLSTLKFLNRVPFGTTDPIFGKDISFYVFTLPVVSALLSGVILITVLFVIVTGLFYFMMINAYPPEEGILYRINEFTRRPNLKSVLSSELAKYVAKKLSLLAALLFTALGVYFYLRGFGLMYSTRGVAFGASYTDIKITLRMYQVLSVISIVSAIGIAYGLLKNKLKAAAAGPVTIIAILFAGSIFALIFQQLVVAPDEINKEREYLGYNIDYTQSAFNLDEIETLEFPVSQDISISDVKANEGTMSNIRINDARPLNQTFNQIQVIRLYYDFVGIDIDRYLVDGEYTEVFVSVRELNQEKLDSTAKTWLNKHLKYTLGYGLVMAPVNEVTGEGQPKLIYKNIPPVTDTDLTITRPEVYFGELTDDYVIVGTKEKEFDYPSGSDNQENLYEGDAGVSLAGLRRLLFSMKEKSMKLLFSSNVTNESRILLNRNISDRVKKIAPFLELDNNPYIVLRDDGTLTWIMDAYTVSSEYPYSEYTYFGGKKINYIRNSVKITIDAYNGNVDFYIIDEDDPLIKTYEGIYKDVFKSIDEMPMDLKSHIKYPQAMFDLQSYVLRRYHVDNPVVFYNGEDIWDIANEKFMQGTQEIESSYVMFKLPGKEDVEFSIIKPYTPKEKPNMTSILVGRNDGEEYGKLLLYKLPKDRTIDGPMMIESRIDQDSTISPQFTLWGQEGSSVLRGNVIIVPLNDSLLYVEPVYIQADNENSIPEMKRVIVAYKDKIVMEENLDLAISKIFSTRYTTSDSGSADVTDDDTLTELREKYDEIKKLLLELEETLNKLETE